MKYLYIALALAAIAYLGYEAVRFAYYVHISQGLVEKANAFTRADGTRTMLVLGDSTAVGVGSESALTVAGRVSNLLNASVENYAMSGAVVADLASQLARTKKSQYDVVLIHIGANDIIRGHSLSVTKPQLDDLLLKVRGLSDHVVLLTAGRVGSAPLFPWFMRALLNNRSHTYRDAFKAAADARGVAYIDLYNAADPMSEDPARYYAPDGLHLTSDGYGFWYSEVKKVMETRWPELIAS